MTRSPARYVTVLLLGAAGLAFGSAAWGAEPEKAAAEGLPYEIPVLVIKYFPVKGDRLDRAVTGDWGETLDATRAKTDRVTQVVKAALEEGSRYHAYKDPTARPSLKYTILATLEFLEPLPVRPRQDGKVPLTDYGKIMERVGIKDWVETKGVKEVWLWGYHGGVVVLWESNMAGPWGDISNSNRDPADLPVLSKTYTVYHYNYQRGPSEACENHMHQLEHVLNWVDGRDRTPHEKWGDLLLWGKFVGSDISHKIVRPGCGWSHYPPNGEQDYDWANKRYVESDIEDWKPDGTGRKQPINCDRWAGDSLRWFIYWMQSIPGAANGLSYQGKPLRNWWRFIADFDGAMAAKMKLWEEP
ncbi:MAG TPA: hypothetical protein VM431_14265 [Phycisphaerae bacterium]|nr:hypothetical protein [Phycisphaerae bacterium]